MFETTATNLPRVMVCNGSRLMAEAEAPHSGDDTIRNEGIAADWLVGQVHGKHFTVEDLIDRKSPNGVYIEPEMVEHLEEYLGEVDGGEIEVTVNNIGENWRVNGRADLIKHRPGVLLVGDLKYGYRIVEAEENWTLISHAMSWVAQHPEEKIEWFTFAIYQPRAYHPEGSVRYWSINNVQMQDYFDQIPAKLSNLDDQLQTGEHCYGCPSFTTCPAARKAEMNCLEASHKAFDDKLTDDELATRLDELARAEAMLKQSNKAFKELAIHRLKKGQIVKNYACDTELTNRQWKKDVTPEFIKMMSGIDVTTVKLISPAQTEKAGVPKEFVATLTERRNKGVKLVRIDADKQARKLLKL